MSSRSMFQVHAKQSLPVSLTKTCEHEVQWRLSCSAAPLLAFRRSIDAGFSIRKHARIRTAATHIPAIQVTSVETTIPSTSTSVTNPGWIEFAENISGEWDGFGAKFTTEGTPVELPESVVPDAYREWDVKVFDWQTQCPTLAHANFNCPYFMYKTIKLLPTVGCEADAATRYDIQEKNISEQHHSVLAYQSSGCYVAVWPIAKTNIKSVEKGLELEHCLIDPRDRESRVRVIQVLGLHDSVLRLQNIKVFVEQWYGPFRNGDQLGGCSIRDTAFATTKSLNASQVIGSWQGMNAVASFRNSQNTVQQLGNECVRQLNRDAGNLILLPKNLWCSVQRVGDEEAHCEVGWLLDQGQAITSKCTFSSTAEVQEIAIAANETAISLA